jgi:hypothetical protein
MFGDTAMKTKAWIILLIPLTAPVAIFRTDHFDWQVVPGSSIASVVCWLGWIGALVFGFLMLWGKWQHGRAEGGNR